MSLRLRQLRRFAATSGAKPASNAISAASAFGSSAGTAAASPLPLKDQVIAVVPVTLPTVHVSVAGVECTSRCRRVVHHDGSGGTRCQ